MFTFSHSLKSTEEYRLFYNILLDCLQCWNKMVLDNRLRILTILYFWTWRKKCEKRLKCYKKFCYQHSQLTETCKGYTLIEAALLRLALILFDKPVSQSAKTSVIMFLFGISDRTQWWQLKTYGNWVWFVNKCCRCRMPFKGDGYILLGGQFLP